MERTAAIVLTSHFCAFFFAKQTLMSALMALFSVTAVLTALTCLGGTTVSAEMGTMTMGCFHQVENRVKVSTRRRPRV